MKLHSIPLGGMQVLTKPCASPQVVHGSTRLTGCGRVGATARGLEPSGQWCKSGTSNQGRTRIGGHACGTASIRKKQMMSDSRRSVRLGTAPQRSAVKTAKTRVLPSCPRGLRSVPEMFRFPSNSGSARTSPALERLELCETKVSGTVLRGAG